MARAIAGSVASAGPALAELSIADLEQDDEVDREGDSEIDGQGDEGESGEVEPSQTDQFLIAHRDDFEQAGLTIGSPTGPATPELWSSTLSALTDDQATACWDWLEDVPEEGSDESDKEKREEWRAAAPKFIRFTGETTEATEDDPAREVIEFVLEESMEKKLKRLEARMRKTEEAEAAVRNQALAVLGLESKVDEAKGELKAARERWEQLVCVLQQVITDAKSGQRELPFPDDGGTDGNGSTDAATQAARNMVEGAARNGYGLSIEIPGSRAVEFHPLQSLSTKNIAGIVGAAVVESHKQQDDPIGLSEAQLDKLESACESSTVEGLEKWIAQDQQWHRKISGFGEKAINRVVSTLVAFRAVKPIPTE